jgi:hypothetical protein
MNAELENKWKEAAVEYFNILSQEELKITSRNLNQESLCPGRDSNQVPPKYKSEALPLHATCSA